MSIDNENHADTDDTNLDDFSAEFFGENETLSEDAKPEVDEEVDDTDDAPPEDDQDTQDTDEQDDTTDDGEDTSEDSSEDEDEEPTPKPKKKNSAQERISELTAARREAERRADALEARLAAIEAKSAPKDEPTPAPTQKSETEVSPPKPNDTNEDGTDKYPLGEFDPNYITDLADFRVEQRFAERERQEQERAEQARQQEQLSQLETQWNGQLETARERYPDYNEKLTELQPVFSDVPEHYGDYLSNTLMSMEKGADILYYLADHPDEARAIVGSGPQRATIALGRLEARFMEGESSAPVRKASKAPAPPPTNKGSSAARGKVQPDTDDLDAFETLFFKK